jgi:hypothetical protein
MVYYLINVPLAIHSIFNVKGPIKGTVWEERIVSSMMGTDELDVEHQVQTATFEFGGKVESDVK